MIFVGNHIFTYDDYGIIITDTNIGTPTEVRLKNSIVDELYMETKTKKQFTTDKESWTPTTVLKAPFTNDLHAGNINLAGLEITELRFKRRKIDSTKWIHFATIPYTKEQEIYSVLDKFNASFDDYEYAVTPYASGIEGDYKTKQILSEFEGCFIFDKENMYSLVYNFELGDIVFNIPSSTIDTLNGEYPIVTYNSNMRNKVGSIKCMLVSDSTIESDGQIDGKQEKLLRNKIIQFLTNKKPKCIKDGAGNAMVMDMINNPKLTPENSLNQMIYQISFDFVETGNIENEQTLRLFGLI